ncbi:ABC transporter permease subunit, partial [Streptomyces sp. NPDC048845]|uniref:ABC transporter permease subunit n=1 Tax=Streptomyces sp. NPDC048845 TaxID=3155390 RepID=UPI00343C6B91
MRGLPRELDEAARIDGCGHLRIFWSIVLPLCQPGGTLAHRPDCPLVTGVPQAFRVRRSALPELDPCPVCVPGLGTRDRSPYGPGTGSPEAGPGCPPEA